MAGRIHKMDTAYIVWWRPDIETLYVLLALSEWNPPFVSEIYQSLEHSLQKVLAMQSFDGSFGIRQAVEQTINLQVTWDTKAFLN